jgi:hypothetical protein
MFRPEAAGPSPGSGPADGNHATPEQVLALADRAVVCQVKSVAAEVKRLGCAALATAGFAASASAALVRT